jgi:type II secretory pathway pseudopilin PulG
MNVKIDSKRAVALNRNPTRSSQGFTLIETLVYMGLLFVTIGIAFVAMYRSMDASAALRRNANDIVRALNAGEQWREDIRDATGPIHLGQTAQGITLRLPHGRDEVEYLITTNAVSRRIDSADWAVVLDRVKLSVFVNDRREKVTAWRWEIELQPGQKRITRIRPLFTFVAVPPTSFAQ